MTSTQDFHISDCTLDNYLPVDLTWSLELNIWSNHAEHLKRLAPFLIHVAPLYIRSVIIFLAISNSFQSLFRSLAIVAYLEQTFSANSTYSYVMSSATSNWWAWSGIPKIYYYTSFKEGKNTPAIYIVSFGIFVIVLLSALVTDFLI